MKAYSTTIGKREFVAELKKHREQDNFVRGSYWSGGKGCAVGCSLESIGRVKQLKLDPSSHALYPVHLGIPEWLARVEDSFFEHMSVEKSKDWPVRFAQAIPVGANLEKAKVPFIIMLLEHSLVSMKAAKYDEKANPAVKNAITGSIKAVKQMIKAQKTGKGIEAAGAAAWSAAWSG